MSRNPCSAALTQPTCSHTETFTVRFIHAVAVICVPLGNEAALCAKLQDTQVGLWSPLILCMSASSLPVHYKARQGKNIQDLPALQLLCDNAVYTECI